VTRRTLDIVLTSYGFSIFGDRAQTVAYGDAVAFVVLLAAIARFVRVATRRAEHQLPVAAPD
jgi:hypothetical protein